MGYQGRNQAANDASRNKAKHHREPWSEYEVEFLVELWDGTEQCLVEIAEELGRTIAACRQRWYEYKWGHSRTVAVPVPLHQPGWLGYVRSAVGQQMSTAIALVTAGVTIAAEQDMGTGMAAKPRFMMTKSGRVHVVTTPGNDNKMSSCPVVKRGHKLPAASGGWGRRNGLSPDAALACDDCAKCGSHELATQEKRAAMTPAQKRAEAKAQSDETRAKMSGRKPPKRKEPGARRGPRSTDPARGKELAQEHLELAVKHGWQGHVSVDGNEVTVEVSKDEQTCKLIYRDGKICWSRVTFASGREVKLRNSGNWRKQVTLPVNKRPGQDKVGATGRGGSRRAQRNAVRRGDEGTDDTRTVPFTMEDDQPTILEAVGGKQIVWRNTMTDKLDTARVPKASRHSRVTEHPKSDRRILSFYEVLSVTDKHGEQLGAERSVYLDKIIEVGTSLNDEITGKQIHYLGDGEEETACGKPGWIGVVRDDMDQVTCSKCKATAN